MTITYNHLNLPRLFTWTSGSFNGNSVEILYDAAGTKLKKTVKTGATVNYTQEYIGGIEYRDGVREAIYHAEGRVKYTSPSTTRYEYTIKDHLGNARISFSDLNGNGVVNVTNVASTNEVLQENHYYPFGLNMDGKWMNDAALDNKYQYNGKEWNDDFGLNLNDYGARWYDGSLGRFFSVDPLVNKMASWSSYNYVFCRPVSLTDHSGMAPDGIILDGGGSVIGNDGKDDGKLYVMKTQQKDFDGVSGAGLSKKDAKATKNFIEENSGNSNAFDQNQGIYDNLVEIEGKESTRQAMVDIVSQDNGEGGSSDSNNREYGGQIKSDGTVVQDAPGPVSNPTLGAHIGRVVDPDSKAAFHSHPSGTISKVVDSSTNDDSQFGGTTSYGGTTTTTTTPYRQTPSSPDITNAGTSVRYTFGMGSTGTTPTVYIYNNSGVQATLPLNKFVKQN